MVDETTAKKVKKFANLYKDILLNDGEQAYQRRKEQDSKYGILDCAELFITERLTSIYTDIVSGSISRLEGAKRQNALLSTIQIQNTENDRIPINPNHTPNTGSISDNMQKVS